MLGCAYVEHSLLLPYEQVIRFAYEISSCIRCNVAMPLSPVLHEYCINRRLKVYQPFQFGKWARVFVVVVSEAGQFVVPFATGPNTD